MHRYGIQKDGNDNHPSKATRDTDVKNRRLDSGRRRGWDDLREQYWNMYITICKRDGQCKFDA